MKDYYAIARRNVFISLTVIGLAIVSYVYVIKPLVARHEANQRKAAEQTAQFNTAERCIETKGFSIRAFLLEDSRLIQAEPSCELNALQLWKKNEAALESELEKCRYESEQTRIAHTEYFCNQWALCSKGAPYKEMFNVCYETFGPKSNDTSSSESGDD